MTLFKKKNKKEPSLYFNLNRELKYARARKQTCFYYLINESDISKVMNWGIKNRVSIVPSYITDGKIYYKFYKYSMEE